jgi:hypothetical protein
MRGSPVLAPRWLWSDEVMAVIDAEMTRTGISLGELARRAAARFGGEVESAERRVRAARRPGRVMGVHAADRYLVLVGLHLVDVPSYRAALAGDLDPADWPRRQGPSRPPHMCAPPRLQAVQ